MNARKILADNLHTIKAHYQLSNLKLAKRCGVGNGTIGRALLGQVALDIDTVSDIADALGLQVWQLLAPGLDPQNPHVITQLTEAERDLYAKLSKASVSAKSTT